MSRKPPECPIFGNPRRMDLNMLPTVEEVLMDYQWIRFDHKNASSHTKEPTVSEISDVLANKIKEIWNRASIPTVTVTRIVQLIKVHHEKYNKLLWYPVSRRNEQYVQKVEDFRQLAKRNILDIAACKCADFSLCKCEKTNKVPTLEQKFLQDQRSTRKMKMGGIDHATSKKLEKRQKRKSQEKERLDKYQSQAASQSVEPESCQFGSDTEGSITYSTQDDSDEDMLSANDAANASNSSKVIKQQRRLLENTARASERHAVSDRAVAEIASAVLQDFGVVTAEDSSEVIDRSKIRRERLKYREMLREETSSSRTDLLGIYFDGRKDKTLSYEIVDGTAHRRVIVEEHVSLVQEPGSNYIGHITPGSGSASSIQTAIVSFLQTNNIDIQHLLAVGCDGTAVNTGKKGGVIRLLEEHIKRPLQYFVCLLHANELPLRHLFEHIDGKTSGPRSFTGPIGCLLQKCETLPIVSYEPISCDFPSVTVDDLSSDQQYLLNICQAVITGECSVSLSHRQPGQLVMSRWLTLANRVLRLYVATEKPTDNLKKLVEFVIKVYAPMWFTIKSKPSCKDGSRHLWMQMKRSRYLPDEMKAVVDPVIQRNGYFGHPENILLAMLTDEKQHIRQLGLRRIMRARASKVRLRGVRSFEVPPLNFNADEYFDIIDWQKCLLTEPPVTKSLSDEELESLIQNESTAVVEFPRFPCHTQAVERCVKSVTEAATAVVGQEARDGFILARLNARAIMPTFETKCEYRTTK